MTMKRWNGVSWFDLTTAKRWNGVAWIDLTVAKRWNGTSWIDIALPGGPPPGSVVATMSPGAVSGSVSGVTPAVRSVTSNFATLTVAGGTGPYAYQWTRVSGSSGVLITAPNANSTSFHAAVPKGDTRQATMRCTVTDSLSASSFADVLVTLSYINLGDDDGFEDVDL